MGLGFDNIRGIVRKSRVERVIFQSPNQPNLTTYWAGIREMMKCKFKNLEEPRPVIVKKPITSSCQNPPGIARPRNLYLLGLLLEQDLHMQNECDISCMELRVRFSRHKRRHILLSRAESLAK